MDSSRVGLMMTQPVPLRGENLSVYSSCTAGTRKASVLPEPVRAAPMMSLTIHIIECTACPAQSALTGP